MLEIRLRHRKGIKKNKSTHRCAHTHTHTACSAWWNSYSPFKPSAFTVPWSFVWPTLFQPCGVAVASFPPHCPFCLSVDSTLLSGRYQDLSRATVQVPTVVPYMLEEFSNQSLCMTYSARIHISLVLTLITQIDIEGCPILTKALMKTDP